MQKRLRELREDIRYIIDRIFAREFTGQLILFFVVVVTVTAIGMTALLFGLFSAENAKVSGIPRKIDQGVWDSMWWSLNQVLHLRGFQRMYGASGPILGYSLVLSVMGLVVFGVLISMINNTMRSRIEALSKGDTPVRERGHVLVLGWNNKLFAVLQQLARLAPGLKVVILAPLEIDEMQEALRVFGIQHERLTVILRTGTPSNRGELKRVAVDRATSVIILATENDDSEAIKTMVLLAAKDDWRGQLPVLISEIALEQNNELARIAGRDKIHIICSSRVISKVIIQTVRNPGLAAVIGELSSLDGNSIQVQKVKECLDHSLREVAFGFAGAIPIGIAWQEDRDGIKRHVAGLNPEPDYEIAEDEQLVLISRGSQFSYKIPDTAYQSSIYQEGLSETRAPSRILLIGWTDILFDMLLELDAHALRGTEVAILSRMLPEQAAQEVNGSLGRSLKNLSLTYHQGNAVKREVYRDLDLGGYQSIVVLADASAGKGDVDTRTLRILLRISDLRKDDKFRAHTVVELLNETNRELFVGLSVDDIIVSSEVVSAQLAQIARQQILGPIYGELLSAGGVEISLRPAGDYVALDTDCRFADLIFAAQQKMEIALGLRLDGNGGKALLNPSRQRTWRLGERDQVIVMAQQLYR